MASIPRAAANVGDLTLQGWSGGLQAGYNFQYNAFVFGAEADIEGGDISRFGIVLARRSGLRDPVFRQGCSCYSSERCSANSDSP